MARFYGVQVPAWVPPWGPWAALAALGVGLVVAVRSSLEGGGGSGGSDGGGGPGGDSEFGGLPVDPYAAREIATADDCDPTAKPGVVAFRRWMVETFGEPKSPSVQNIVRDCSVGGASEHKEGRAYDYMTQSLEHGQSVADALTATDAGGNPNALMRRAGVMNAIWNKRIWRSYPQGDLPAGQWGPYTGPNPHTDHVHVSFGWPGAMGGTSLYESGAAPLSPPNA